jgi:hypothetical protein
MADYRLGVRFPRFDAGEDNDGVSTKRSEWSELMKTEQKQKHVGPALVEIGFQSYSTKEKRGILVSTLTSKSFSRFRVERS